MKRGFVEGIESNVAAGNDAVEMGDGEKGCGWIAVVVDKCLERRVESCSGGNCSVKRNQVILHGKLELTLKLDLV